MEEYQIKDTILKTLQSKKGSWKGIDYIFATTGGDEDEIRALLQDIEKDGYIAWPSPFKMIYINVQGTRFIKRGGYTQQDFKIKLEEAIIEGEETLERRRTNWDRGREWGLAIIALALAILNVIQYLGCK